jgi:hypothetical protein
MSLMNSKHVSFEGLVSEAMGLHEWSRAFNRSLSLSGFKYVLDPRLRQA